MIRTRSIEIRASLGTRITPILDLISSTHDSNTFGAKPLSIRRRWGPLLSLLFLLFSNVASAHSLGEGYVFLEVGSDAIEGRVELTMSTLDSVLNLDKDADGKVSDKEFFDNTAAVQEYVFSRFDLGDLEGWYEVQPGEPTVGTFPLGRYALLHFSVDNITRVPTELRIKYELLFDTEPKHRGLVLVERNALTGEENFNEAVSLVMTPDHPVQTLDLMNATGSTGLLAFIKHGIWHIWIGADHIAFLLTLLLQSVLIRQGSAWKPAEGFRPALYNVAKIVTLFTVAHTLTLSMAALGIFTLPPRIVESVIAGSIFVAAVLNFFPSRAGNLYYFIFIFGLFHGFGFASVLGHLTSQSGSMVTALLGFNLGVEMGQLAVVCATFPILFLVRSKKFYQPFTLKMGSAVIGLVAVLWLVERVFALDPIVPF